MAAMTLDDGGWGSIASNFANALNTEPTKRAQIYVQGAQYQKLLLEAEEQKRKMAAVQDAVRGYPSTIPREVTLPPIDGQEQFGPPLPAAQQAYSTNRAQQIRDNAAASYLARDASDYAKGVFPTRALSEVSGGIPSSPGRQDVLQTLISPSGGSLPNYSTTPHTYQPTDAAGAPYGAPISSRRIPEGPSTMVSPTAAGPMNPFENSGTMDQKLLALSQKAARAPDSLSLPEVEEAAVLLQNRHGVKIAQGQGPDGSRTMTATRENPYPEQYNRLVERVAELNWYRNEKAAAASEGRPMREMPPFIPPALMPPPDARTGGLAGTPPVVPPGSPVGTIAEGPPVPAVPVAAGPGPTVGGLPVGTNVGAPVQVAAGDATPLRKEFNDQPPVKSYFKAVTPYKQFVENIKVGTPQADISMIYNLAKMLDPDSVVREGEMLIWKKSGGPFDQLQGLYDKVIADNAAITPKVRANLADMAERVMGATHSAYKEEAERYGELASAYGIPPEKIVPKIGDLPKIDRKTISSITPAGAGPKGAPEKSSVPAGAVTSVGAPTTPSTAPARGRTIRVNPQTGAIEEVR